MTTDGTPTAPPSPVQPPDDQRCPTCGRGGAEGRTGPVYDGYDSFLGFAPRTCGEHRTVGAYRAWCHDCSMWCYPASPCLGCDPDIKPPLDPTVLADVVGHTAASAVIGARPIQDWAKPPLDPTVLADVVWPGEDAG
jgi:hypothetical protein